MADSRQPQLNGAYYGPSIPPPSKPYYRPGRGGSWCCNPFSCLFSCLCTCLCQILCTLLIIVGIVILILWLIYRPNEIKFYAADASLTHFNLDNNTLNYDLALNFTIRNPNRRIGIYYDRIEARAFYEGQRFSNQLLPPFYQGHKNTSFLNAEFKGPHLLVLGKDELSDHEANKLAGTYEIDVTLYLRIRLKFGDAKSPRLKPKVKCDLKIPVNSNTTASRSFELKRCDFDWR